MLKDITLGQYFPGNSLLHRLDPRMKLVLTLCFIVLVFLPQNWWALLAAGLFLLLIVGLSNDELGYIVPPSDFLLNEDLPYLERTQDKRGEDHYEETNSTGPETGRIILETTEKLIKESI